MKASHHAHGRQTSAQHSADKAGEHESSSESSAESDSQDWQQDGQEKTMEAFAGKSYSKRREFKYCVRKFTTLQDRLAKMEAYVTSSQFRLHREFKNI